MKHADDADGADGSGHLSSAPSAPDQAGRVFPAQRLGLAQRYAELLATEGVVRGLVGPRETPRLWDRHLLNCAALTEVVALGSSVCDVGSGAGLPGLVLAIARPDLEITLVEPLLRRTTFLTEVIDELGLDRVEVVRGRAEALAGTRRFDLVTSRAVASLDVLLAWSMPLVAPSGAALALKGASAAEEIEAARGTLERLGCAEPEVLSVGAGTLASPATVVRVTWRDPTRVSWPAVASRVRARPSPKGRDTGSRPTPDRRRRNG